MVSVGVSGLGCVVALLGTECFLNRNCGLLLTTDLLCGKLCPELFKLGGIALDVEGVINDEKVLLIVGACLESPVEGASQQEHSINNHKLVVHVVLRVIVSSNRNAEVCQVLTIISLVGHALVVGDDTDIDTLSLHVLDSSSKHVVRKVEDTDK